MRKREPWSCRSPTKALSQSSYSPLKLPDSAAPNAPSGAGARNDFLKGETREA
jgi:hypothetical protein